MKKIIYKALCFGLFLTAAVSGISAKESKSSAKEISVQFGKKPVTNGFADLGKLSYMDSSNFIVIDDKTYPTAQEKRTAFTNAIASGDVKSSDLTAKPAVIYVKGAIDLSDGKVSDKDHSYFEKFDETTHKRVNGDIQYKIGSNKTIIGDENAKIAFGGLQIYATAENPASNIIIRNILFWDDHGATEYDTAFKSDSKASADQLVVQGTPEKDEKKKDTGAMIYTPSDIWIDHCTFTDGTCHDLDRNFSHDGALDVKAVHNMTISYCEFTNHDKVTLVGPGDKFVNPADRQITFHNNYYHGTVQRMPRSRGCQIHIYNNYYDQIGTDKNSGYSFGPGIGSQFIIENNYLGSHKGKILRYNDSSEKDEPTFSRFYNKGNKPELSPENSEWYDLHHTDELPWKIEYEYKLAEVSDLNPENAGSGCKVSIK